MSSLPGLPFEKNRYYGGKMLTSADFCAEQSYVDGKQMFLNVVTWGSGILCGLAVKRLDDSSFLVDSGAAIDGAGHLVVVEKACVKTFSSVRGSDGLKGKSAILYLAYAQEEVQEVRAVNRYDGQDEYQKNRIQETYEFYLEDWKEMDEEKEDRSFFAETSVVRNKDYVVSMRVPRYASRGKAVRLSVRIQKLSDAELPFEFYGFLQLPAFMTENGEKEIDIGCQEICLEKGDFYCRDYWILPDHEDIGETEIFLKPDTVRALAGTETCSFRKNARLHVTFTKDSPRVLAKRMAGRASLDAAAGKQGGIPLAVLELEEKEDCLSVSCIHEADVRSYISVPCREEEQEGYLSWYKDPPRFRTDSKPEPDSGEEGADSDRGSVQPESMIRGGMLEIPLDIKMKKGQVCYSEEIVHGLGPGNVYVDVGILCGENTVVYGDVYGG